MDESEPLSAGNICCQKRAYGGICFVRSSDTNCSGSNIPIKACSSGAHGVPAGCSKRPFIESGAGSHQCCTFRSKIITNVSGL
jgi:hypothetical protein